MAYILLIIFGEKGFPAQCKHGETLGRKASDLSPDSQGYGSKTRLPGKYNTLIVGKPITLPQLLMTPYLCFMLTSGADIDKIFYKLYITNTVYCDWVLVEK